MKTSVLPSVSASLVRNLVSTIFNVNPTKVILSDREIDPNYQSIYSTLSGGMWSSNEITTLWGFSPQTGFKEIKEVQYSEWNTPDGMPQNDRENTLKLHEVPGIKKYIFFLEKKECHNSIPSNGVNENSITWTLYKAPNFSEFWAKIEHEDLERWSNWLIN